MVSVVKGGMSITVADVDTLSNFVKNVLVGSM